MVFWFNFLCVSSDREIAFFKIPVDVGWILSHRQKTFLIYCFPYGLSPSIDKAGPKFIQYFNAEYYTSDFIHGKPKVKYCQN